MEYLTKSAEETKKIAATLAKQLNGVIALSGELGAGKTTFVQGFAQGLGIKDKIISPTFILIRQHPISNSKRILYHLDLYRLEEVKDIKDLGIEEMTEYQENIVLIEWAEKAKDLLPKNITWIKFEIINENSRKITVE